MIKKTVLLTLFASWLVGCASFELRSSVLNLELIKQLQRGVTNKQEALTLFGNPTMVKVEKGLEQWVYLKETRGVPAPSGPAGMPTHALSRGEVPIFPEKKGEGLALPGRTTKELTLTFQGDTLVDYNIRDL